MRLSLIALTLGALFAGCSDDETSSTSGSGGSSATTTTSSSSGGGSGTTDCTGATTNAEQAVCAANAFLATLSDTELAAVKFEFSDATTRTKWSNLPTRMKERAGMALGDLGETAQASALAMMKIVLSDAGYTDLVGVRAADQYLLNQNATDYGEGLYYISVFGTPSTTEDWSLMMTGHHMAFMVNYVGGVAYPIPNHLAVEPKASFDVDGTTYEPMKDEADAMIAVFNSLTDAQKTSAFLSGQTINDLVVGAVEHATGSLDSVTSKYPTGANRTGILVSDLPAAQQALVTTAIEGWVGDFNAEISDDLVAEYTSADALADTYVAFAGDSETALDFDTTNTYIRIDGPRLWIELLSPGGIVIRGTTHYHSIYRDKELDYGGSL